MSKLLALLYCVSFFIAATAIAQPKFERFGTDLYGEYIVGLVAMPHTEAYAATATSFYGCDDVTTKQFTKIWETPSSRKIIQIVKKIGGSAILILLDSGDSYEYKVATRQLVFRGHFSAPAGESVRKIVETGNSIFTSNYVFSSNDNGLNWHIDTTGFTSKAASIRPIEICADTAGNIYVFTQKAVVFRHRDSSTYTTVSTFPSTKLLTHVYIDRTNTFFAQSNSDNSLYISKDNGVTWVKDTGGFYLTYITGDAYGDVFGIGQTVDGGSTRYLVMRRYAKNGAWAEVQNGIAQLMGTLNSYNTVLSTDSIVLVGSSQGVFLSDYRIYPWKRFNDGISSEHISGIAKSASGDLVVGNNMALFSLKEKASTWKQLFPKDADGGFIPVYGDQSGSIFTQTTNGITSGTIIPFWQSDDDGEHWKPDTLGWSVLSNSQFTYIDRLGGIHLVYYPSSINKSTTLRSLKKGGRWEYDTTNLQAGPDSYLRTLALSNDNYFYASLSANGHHILRREIDSKTWEPDIAPVPDSVIYFDQFVAGNGSDLYGIGNHRLYKRSNNAWTLLPLPQSVPPLPTILRIGYDSSGRIYASIYHYGVFISSDDGVSWKNAGLDSIVINQFHSYGDTTFAISADRGMYRILNGNNGAVPTQQVSEAAIHLTANPVTNSAHFQYDIAHTGFITLNIFDALGREVVALLNGFEQAGVHSVNWDTEAFASGTYYFQFIERANTVNTILQSGTIIVKH